MSFKIIRLQLLLAFFLSLSAVNSQNQADSTQVNKARFRGVVLATSLTYASTLVGLNQLWYAGYEQSSIHTFNDNGQWLQMDKLGHVCSAHLGGAFGYEALRYAGFDSKRASIYGGGLGFVFLTTVEVFDGFSEEWGFSWGDMASNGIGSALFIVQELKFGKQILQPKFSYSPSTYRKYRPEILGESQSEAFLKDYNAQTYWASLNLNSIYSKIQPSWLNLAFGYGGNAMVQARGAFTSEAGHYFKPYRQYYLSLDIDLTEIPSRKVWLRRLLRAANYVKIPAPTLEFREGGHSKFHFLFF